MKKTQIASLIIAATIATTAVAAAFKPAAAITEAAGSKPAAANLTVNIQDPELLAAWNFIYNSQTPVTLWDGSTLTGRELAQFVLDQGIPVVWDMDNACRGGSCSYHSCDAGVDVCSFDDGKPGVDPIYIRPGEMHDMPAIIDTMAHEIFHRTMPFGAVHDSRFEEFWAYYIGETVANYMALKFAAYDPLDPALLNLWLKDNGIEAYLTLVAYPAAVADLVHVADNAVVNNLNGLPSAAYGQ